jgi:hypothetical protein
MPNRAAASRPFYPPPTRHRDFRYRLDRSGQQHFNFPQRVWVRASVAMACTRAPSTALTTLALNMLVLALVETANRKIPTDRHIGRKLAQRFAVECLLSAPASAWVIPKAVVRTWAATHR